jgi:hypothetical protein
VIAGMREVRYRGAIDDQCALGTRKDAAARRDLAGALDAVLAGRKVATPATPVAGCPLDRVRPQVATRKTPELKVAGSNPPGHS